MIISVNVPSETRRDGFREFVVDRITRTLARLAHRVISVNVTLTDENRTRGGINKQCRMTVVVSGLGQIRTSAKHENPLVAVRLASDRARRKVLTKLKRPTALRVRRSKIVPGPRLTAPTTIGSNAPGRTCTRTRPATTPVPT